MIPVQSKTIENSGMSAEMTYDSYQSKLMGTSKNKNADKLALVCSIDGFKRTFNLFPMPEETKQKNLKQGFIMSVERLQPSIVEKPILMSNLLPINLENAKIFTFFEVNQ